MRPVKLVLVFLLGLGLLSSLYLLPRHFVLAGHAAATPDVCSVVFGSDCDRALQSPAAFQAGLPLAAWGIVYYLTLTSLFVMALVLGQAFELEAMLATLLLSIAGALASVAMLLFTLQGRLPVCPLCVVVLVTNIGLVLPIRMMTPGTRAELLQALRAGGRFVLGRDVADAANARWKTVALFTAALLAGVIYQRLVIVTGPIKQSWVSTHEIIDAYKTGAPVVISSEPEDAVLGPPSAANTLVVFSDFQCSYCSVFSRTATDLVQSYGGSLRVVFKHFPLSPVCNDSMNSEVHPQACPAAWAAEAARRQGAFASFHDKLFSADLTIEGSIVVTAREVGLDLGQFEEDRGSERVKQRVRADVDLGVALGVEGTPTAFLNGRRVGDLRPAALRVLIEHVAVDR